MEIFNVLIVFLVIFVIAWEMWLLATKRELISQTIHRKAKEDPIMPFLIGLTLGLVIGIFAGHFWPLY